MESKRKFWLGLGMLALSLVGLLLVFGAFRKKVNTSSLQPEQPEPAEPEPEPERIPEPGNNTDNFNDVEIEIEPNTLDNSTDSIIHVYELIRDNVPGDETFHKLVLAQSMHETGIFTSELTRENNNLFGMRNPVVRNTVSLGDLNGYAIYNNIEDSVRDYALYLKAREIQPENIGNVELFVKKLKEKAYFTDNFIKYLGAVKKHFNFIKTLIQ